MLFSFEYNVVYSKIQKMNISGKAISRKSLMLSQLVLSKKMPGVVLYLHVATLATEQRTGCKQALNHGALKPPKYCRPPEKCPVAEIRNELLVQDVL